jgi:amino-acid N-acetyltransferase
MNDVTIARVETSDVPALFDLLTQQSLPLEGLADHLGTTLVARRQGQIIGSAAVEIYPDGGLLRSVAIATDLHGQGIGRALTEAAFSTARVAGLDTLYLLTTTAEHYFPKLGFEAIAREEVPAGVRTSVEFTSACPSSAIVMRKRL